MLVSLEQGDYAMASTGVFDRGVRAMLAALPPAVQITAPSLNSDAISHDELVRYAQALLQVRQLRSDSIAKLTSLSGSQRDALQAQMRERVSAILAHEDLSRARFNALSSAVEKDVLVQQRVQQIIVEQQIGT